MKKISLFVCFAAFIAAPCFGDDENAVTLVYPMTAAQTELDDSTPAKRTTPPVREDSEYDPISPIGQIRDIVNTLNKLENQQDSILETVGKLQLGENKDLLPLLERGAKNQDTIVSNVNEILQTSKVIGTKIDDLKKMTSDLRATVEAVQKTAASVERIRTSRWTDYAVGVILALVIIQLVWRACSSISGVIKARAAKWQEIMRIYEQHNAETAQK